MSATLTLDEQLVAFLESWEARRAALVTKYSIRAEEYQHRAGMRICYEGARRSQRHYEHEVRMIQELRRRAFQDRSA